MKYNNTIFNQLANFLPKDKFNQFVGQHNGNKYTKKLTAWNQLIVLLYAQATGKESLRDIETAFNINNNDWYHLGVNTVSKSSISYANNNRDYQIFEKLFYSLLEQCKNLIPERKFSFENPLYSFDSSTIELCLSVFNWASYRTAKGAIKLHTLYNNKTFIPELINISNGKVGDITALKEIILPIPKGSIIVFDRGYIDYLFWKELDKKGIYFVSRTKKNSNIFVVEKMDTKMDKNILKDEKVMFGDYNTLFKKKCDKFLRRITYFHEEKQQTYTYITNNFELKASEIALIYKERWQIELFFKWIKQNLKIKSFLGTSKNAVFTQIWVAMIYYLLLIYIKFQTKFNKSLLELTRMIRETMFTRINLIDLLSLNIRTLAKIKTISNNQLSFW